LDVSHSIFIQTFAASAGIQCKSIAADITGFSLLVKWAAPRRLIYVAGIENLGEELRLAPQLSYIVISHSSIFQYSVPNKGFDMQKEYGPGI
jgi:hypothetical protein